MVKSKEAVGQFVFVCGQRPKDLVITWVVVVVVLDNLLIYFWGARLGYTGHYPNQKVPIQKILKFLGP